MKFRFNQRVEVIEQGSFYFGIIGYINKYFEPKTSENPTEKPGYQILFKREPDGELHYLNILESALKEKDGPYES